MTTTSAVRLEHLEKKREAFSISIELPPLAAFRSRGKASPLLLLEAWAKKKSGDPLLHPNDYALSAKDQSALRKEVRAWLRATRGFRGEALLRALNFHDGDCGPLNVRGRRDGYLHLKWPEDRWRAGSPRAARGEGPENAAHPRKRALACSLFS